MARRATRGDEKPARCGGRPRPRRTPRSGQCRAMDSAAGLQARSASWFFNRVVANANRSSESFHIRSLANHHLPSERKPGGGQLRRRQRANMSGQQSRKRLWVRGHGGESATPYRRPTIHCQHQVGHCRRAKCDPSMLRRVACEVARHERACQGFRLLKRLAVSLTGDGIDASGGVADSMAVRCPNATPARESAAELPPGELQACGK